MGYWDWRKNAEQNREELIAEFTVEEMKRYNRLRMWGGIFLIAGLLLTPTGLGLIICVFLAWRNFSKASSISHSVKKRVLKKKGTS